MQTEKKTAETIAQDLGCTIDQFEKVKDAFAEFLKEDRETDTLEILRYVQSIDAPEMCKLYLVHKITQYVVETNDPLI